MLLLNSAEKKENIELDGESSVHTRAQALGEYFKQRLAVKSVIYWLLSVDD